MIEVWRESFGRLDGECLVGGIKDGIAPAM